MKKIILLIFLYLLSHDLFSQSGLLETKITVEFNNIKLNEVINQLNKKLNHVFSFRNEIFPKNKRVTYKAAMTPLKDVLNNILHDTKIKYFQYGKQIILQLTNNENKINGSLIDTMSINKG
jgi:hypothetical protein